MTSSLTTSLTAILLLILTVTTTAVPEREYYSMLTALRLRGYHLFANAITTTDLHYDIIHGENFTFFAPVDNALYALDMIMSARDYTTALRLHGVPYRLSLQEMRQLPYGENRFETLVKGHEIRIVNSPVPVNVPITVEGVEIAFPGLFYDTHLAVHGLEGIIDFRSLTDAVNASSEAHAPESGADRDYFESSGVNSTSEHARDAHAPSPVAVPVVESISPSRPSSIVSGYVSGRSPLSAPPDVSPANRVSVPVSPRYHAPETKSESVTQPREVHASSPTTSDTFQARDEHAPSPTNSFTISDSLRDTRPREDHSSAVTSQMISRTIVQPVSLATATSFGDNDEADEFTTQVDDKRIDCPVADEDDDVIDGEPLQIANIRRGDVYMRELYAPINMTCEQ
ncbi:FAS1 domain-containing protein [Artemisia annua]|uniref:FAS1 domain-containing protein n=1 Tax=Artemisia annua TaxID=35608 RepID=A0A2U1PI47_ARTAN|nr:FAS1 domain-containing protein [Artemisia annua]